MLGKRHVLWDEANITVMFRNQGERRGSVGVGCAGAVVGSLWSGRWCARMVE